MNIVIATDAWSPQINGVVTTLGKMVEGLLSNGHAVFVLHPGLFNSVPCPTYRSIDLALFPYQKTKRILNNFKPDAIHIATEGPVGLAARRYCLRMGLEFTTSFHTRFAEYVRMRAPIPLHWTYAAMRWFHSPATHTLVPTPTILKDLRHRGFNNLRLWRRGVDTKLFKPSQDKATNKHAPKMVYIGRVAVEKNLEAFLKTDVAGQKIIIGDGPDRLMLEKRYPQATFVGFKRGAELVEIVGHCDVLVFPSRTDTYGVVMLEAMACGVPVAAYPVEGPIDVIKQGITGYMHEDLSVAIKEALQINWRACRVHACEQTWDKVLEVFSEHLVCNNGKKVRIQLKQQKPLIEMQ